jgi:hypothetical protein
MNGYDFCARTTSNQLYIQKKFHQVEYIEKHLVTKLVMKETDKHW